MRLHTALLGASFMLAVIATASAAPAAPAADAGETFTLGQIVVTAPKTAPAPGGVGVGSSSLSAAAIYAFDRQSLDDAANLIPGVSSSNTGGSRNERVLSVRGFSRFQVPLSIDGVRVFLPADNRLDYGRFLTSDIAEIQVAKGYASVLNGPDGMGGAINLVTRKPAKAIEMEARGGMSLGHDGEYTGYNAFGLIGARRDYGYAQASFSRNGVDHTDLSGAFQPTATEDGGHRDLSQNQDWRANVKLGLTPKAADEYTLSYTKQEGTKLAPLSTIDPLSIQRFWTWPYWNLDSLYFLSSTALGDRFNLKTKAYRNTFDNLLRAFDNRTETTQTLGKAFNSYYADQAYGGSAQLDARVTDRDTLGVSLQYREDRHTEWQQSFPGGVTEPHQTSIEDTWSLAAENTLVLRPDLTLTAGVSYDWRDLKQAQDYAAGAFVYYPLHNSSALNGQARLSWKPQAGQELYASVSDRARFPTLFERFSSRFGGAVSNAALKPERAVNYEVGGSRGFGIVQAEGAVFYSDLTDTIVNFPFIYTSCTAAGVCTPNAVTQSRNLGHGTYYGAEISLSAALSATVSVGGNVTSIHRDLRDPTNPAFQPTDVPTDKGFVYLDWRPLRQLSVMPNVDIASDRWTVNTAGTLYYRTGAYTLANLTLEYRLTDGLSVQAGGRNLLDQNYQLVDGFPESGRSIFFGVRARY